MVKMAGNRKLPIDLLIIAGFVFITNVFVLVPVLSDSFLRTYMGIFLVLFLPGYALGNQGDSFTDRTFNFYSPDVCSCILQKEIAA